MKNILIPTDFSDAANNAFLYALNIANQLNVKLYVLYSYMSPILSATHGGQPEMLADVYRQVELSKFEYFKKQVPNLHKLAEEQQLDHSQLVFIIEEGTVLNSVKKTLEKEDIQLIVMGTRGASGFTKDFVGTNTVDVIRNTKKPVLGIPEQAIYSPINKIAFTTLFREKDSAALAEVISFSKIFNAEVFCIHVLKDPQKAGDILMQTNSWTNKFNQEKLDFILLEKNEQSIEATINMFLEENNIDLLAIVKRNRNFFDQLMRSSLTNKFAFHAKTPILVLHEEN